MNCAKNAYQGWKNTSIAMRAKILRDIANEIEEKLHEFAVAECEDQGKLLSLATTIDVPRAIHNFRFFSSYIEMLTEKSTVNAEFMNIVERSPLGVVGLISPWNLPLYLLTWKIAPAIAFGNTVVCKPSEFTSKTAFMLCHVLKNHLPAGVCNILFGDGLVGDMIVAHPEVKAISFTGGTVTGKLIKSKCINIGKKVSLELGGKNANIIFADSDFSDALSTSLKSSFANNGQICLCGSRIFVQSEIYDQFLEGFVGQMNSIEVGNPKDPKSQMSALVSAQHFEKVQSYIQLARDEGGIVYGGEVLDMPGNFMRPCCVTNLDPYSRTMQEEIFGPVVTITPFNTVEEVVSLANSTEYGLSASIWTKCFKKANRTAKALDVGYVWINCWMKRDLLMPFGGTKQSGEGREGGDFSRDFFTKLKTICIAN